MATKSWTTTTARDARRGKLQKLGAAVAAAVALLAPWRVAAQDPLPDRTAIGSAVSWANLAWGFEGGGKDETEGAELVLVDLFDAANESIADYKALGKIVACYFSGGTLEDWREDVINNLDAWENAVAGDMSDWDGEAWLDITKLDELQALMEPRFQLAAAKGCDAVEIDNVDCYANGDCFKQTSLKGQGVAKRKAYQVEYNLWQTATAHELGLSIGLKNGLGMIDELEASYDFAINEQCAQYDECSLLSAFISSGKAVFNVEYNPSSTSCADAQALGIMRKTCTHMQDDDGLCESEEPWTNCFALDFVDNTPTVAPVATPAPVATSAPVVTPAPVATPETMSPAVATRPPTTGTSTFFHQVYADWALLAYGGGSESDLDEMTFVVEDLRADRLASLVAEGHRVICSFSAGKLEANAEEADTVLEDLVLPGSAASGDDAWLDLTQTPALKVLMENRLQSAVSQGCVAVDLGGLNCAASDACLSATEDRLTSSRRFRRRRHLQSNEEVEALQLEYARWIIERSNELGLATGLRNAPALMGSLSEKTAFAIAINCEADASCEQYADFLATGKPLLRLDVYEESAAMPSCDDTSASDGIYAKRCIGSANTCSGDAAYSNCFTARSDLTPPTPPPTRPDTGGPGGSPETPEGGEGDKGSSDLVASGFRVATIVLIFFVFALITVLAIVVYRAYFRKDIIVETSYVRTKPIARPSRPLTKPTQEPQVEACYTLEQT